MNIEIFNIKIVIISDILIVEIEVNIFFWFLVLFSWVGREELYLNFM